MRPPYSVPAISIHAPRTGSDMALRMRCAPCSHFNPRSPHGERLFCVSGARGRHIRFQSTLPARGATAIWRYAHTRKKYFNPRSPHGERLYCFSRRPCIDAFQSTLPARGATPDPNNYKQNTEKISIHAPRTGSDFAFGGVTLCRVNFNPRSPHGERLY